MSNGFLHSDDGATVNGLVVVVQIITCGLMAVSECIASKIFDDFFVIY